jgi:hypothetical protein
MDRHSQRKRRREAEDRLLRDMDAATRRKTTVEPAPAAAPSKTAEAKDTPPADR